MDTYLKDCTVSHMGGTLDNVKTLNISLGGRFLSYPTEDNPRVVYKNFNTIMVMDGGEFEFFGTAEHGDLLGLELEGDLVVQGGGKMKANQLEVTGKSIIEPRHVISNNVVFWTSVHSDGLYSLPLSLETPNDVQSIA